ncbi:unnamed protein product [Rhizoctonia solani]|uniref:Uncharacterized protein n=1 Tax=Rhizoctonia solani TaxID=456999 RepID=A0A8H3HGZ2_9AGAM|nr:unnamed protein product [Rhizoctonia solani]
MSSSSKQSPIVYKIPVEPLDLAQLIVAFLLLLTLSIILLLSPRWLLPPCPCLPTSKTALLFTHRLMHTTLLYMSILVNSSRKPSKGLAFAWRSVIPRAPSPGPMRLDVDLRGHTTENLDSSLHTVSILPCFVLTSCY